MTRIHLGLHATKTPRHGGAIRLVGLSQQDSGGTDSPPIVGHSLVAEQHGSESRGNRVGAFWLTGNVSGYLDRLGAGIVGVRS